MRHLLSLTDLGPEGLARLVQDSICFAGGEREDSRILNGKVVGLYFKGSSTRTRTAFTVGAQRLGALTISYGPQDLQLATGESFRDTGRVLSGFLDALVVRTNATIETMRALAGQDQMAVINAMSENEHPTQAIADLATIKESLGRFEGVHVLYVGEGNNTAAALALAVSMTKGMRLTLVTPEGYGLPSIILEVACGYARSSRAVIEEHHDIARAPKKVDAVYATRWRTMGEPKVDPDWREKFQPYAVNKELMARVSKSFGTIFMHDLPAVRGEDVTDEVLDGPQSRAFRQAQHKMTSAMAVLCWSLGSAT